MRTFSYQHRVIYTAMLFNLYIKIVNLCNNKVVDISLTNLESFALLFT